jgi:hypothetical protein
MTFIEINALFIAMHFASATQPRWFASLTINAIAPALEQSVNMAMLQTARELNASIKGSR